MEPYWLAIVRTGVPFTIAMASQPLKEEAAKAAASMQQYARVQLAQGSNIPLLGLPKDDKAITELVAAWLDDPQNIQDISTQLGCSALEIRSRMRHDPVVFGYLREPGLFTGAFPGWLVGLIALVDLERRNGLPEWKGGPERVLQGETVYFDGREELSSAGYGGGLALLLLFDAIHPKQIRSSNAF